jgi:hypothetical protein
MSLSGGSSGPEGESDWRMVEGGGGGLLVGVGRGGRGGGAGPEAWEECEQFGKVGVQSKRYSTPILLS